MSLSFARNLTQLPTDKPQSGETELAILRAASSKSYAGASTSMPRLRAAVIILSGRLCPLGAGAGAGAGTGDSASSIGDAMVKGEDVGEGESGGGGLVGLTTSTSDLLDIYLSNAGVSELQDVNE